MKRPKNWRETLAPIYQEEGRAIGRMIMHDRSQEEYLWSLLGGTGVWPRWYLYAFATLYREENMTEYNTQKSRKRRKRGKKERMLAQCEETMAEASSKIRV
ncbi:MAG TPA: hypothetical protein DCW74_05560 [Alteromonas australica]|mgnify:CR=1 FL=1|uniref:Uncharacterized protein n=1 Tax=Alteromonas australica TaxID=589873 RepID=A0A350P1M1_9ALTE|nr:hypothetical protein [Alteromonas australica]|tara:strand:- start:341 stop:643 length:303 start_codon:yes stop_codon:yes gene_type:complete